MSKAPVLILGGRSDVGRAVALRFAAAGHPIQLAARDAASLEEDKADIELRHRVEVSLHEFDVLDTAGHEAWVEALPELPGIAICVVGLLGDQAESERDVAVAARVMRTNYEGPVSILGALAGRFIERNEGVLVGVSSVAGERGRASNYLYGSAKAGFTAFLSGLRNRCALAGAVHVVTVLPGFINTRMTEGLDLPARLTAEPDEVADAVFAAVERRRNVIYVRRIWWLVMTVIKALPEVVFKKTRL